MLTSFEACNFKCFGQVRIEHLKRVNLLTGLNDIGKTALLEAMFLHAGFFNPGLAGGINALRGVDKFALNHEVIWGWLFRNHDIDTTIELSGEHTDARRSRLAIRLKPLSQPIEAVSGDGGAIKTTGETAAALEVSRELSYDYEDSSGEKYSNAARIDPRRGIVLERQDQWPTTASYLSARDRFYEEDANKFDELSRMKRTAALVENARMFDSRIKGLALSTAWGPAMIVADLEDQNELMPIAYAGEGPTRFLSILLRLLLTEGGLVLIDEIELGFHHSLLSRAWAAIAKTAQQSNVQVVATTHSRECVKAAHQAFSGLVEYDFALHRLEQVRGRVEAISYDQEALDAAVQAEFEVR